jgi:hypothetical protein
MIAADYLIGGGYSRSDVLGMTPREIMCAVEVAIDRRDAEATDALAITTLGVSYGFNDPKKGLEEIEKLR